MRHYRLTNQYDVLSQTKVNQNFTFPVLGLVIITGIDGASLVIPNYQIRNTRIALSFYNQDCKIKIEVKFLL